MYIREKIRTGLLFGAGTVAIGVCLILIIFFIYTLVLHTHYRAMCLEFNDAVLAADSRDCTVERDGQSWPLSAEALDFYNQKLLEENVVVYSRRFAPADEQSIRLRLGHSALTFTGLEDGTAIQITWESQGRQDSYRVRSTSYTYQQFSAYLSNYIRQIDP